MWELMIFLKKPCGYTYVSDINPVNILGANSCGTHVHIFVKRMYSKNCVFWWYPSKFTRVSQRTSLNDKNGEIKLLKCQKVSLEPFNVPTVFKKTL